ncbi:MAG: ribose-phosphate diphosphokinase [Holosporaceae bacterium]|jgi:ribose-phosphate pyrophosphokinase|nr:ribose-phosphate diphosphokinase [Holosporaceae bacterium]
MEIVYTKNSKELAKALAKELSFSAFPANVRRFNNGEISVSLPKYFRNVVVLASVITNEDWLELFLLLDALRDSKNVILCMPYMGYSRQDVQIPNESFGARLFSRLLEVMNISHCIVLDSHSEPFLRIPFIHISAEKIFSSNIISKYDAEKIVVVSPDIGGAYRANLIARAIGCNFALCNKVRDVFNKLKKIDVVGNVEGKICILVDDIVDSGATICHAAETLLKAGGTAVTAYASHAVLSTGAIEKLEESNIIELTFTDSINIAENLPTKFKKISVASLMAEAIRCIV